MSKIHLLSEQLINKIAAGEIIERPASVVKELVENSIDAGATHITVEVKDGGISLIRVSDDGEGMTREDALNSLKRHATSKISAEEDLYSIKTMGFRGEALPSIAVVSRMKIQTRVRGQGAQTGVSFVVYGGEITGEGEVGMAAGTTIEIADLFYNTPVRKKFLKTPATELGNITQTLERIALSHLEIHFKLLHNEKPVFDYPIEATLSGRILKFVKPGMFKSLYPFEASTAGLKLTGYFSSPDLTKPTLRNQYFFLNKRPIRDKVIQGAINDCYKDTLETGRFPVVFVFLTIDPEFVDVNVHPTKNEVRFTKSGDIYRFVYQALRVELGKSPWIKSFQGEAGLPSETPLKALWHKTYSTSHRDRSSFEKRRYQPPRIESESEQAGGPQIDAPITDQVNEEIAAYFKADPLQLSDRKFFSSLQILGQVEDTYIIGYLKGQLVAVDQHAAAERILYQKIQANYQKSEIPLQQLLIPEKFELSDAESVVFESYEKDFEQLGLKFELFGPGTYLLKTVPVFFIEYPYVQLIQDILDQLFEANKKMSFLDILLEGIKKTSCHFSIRANTKLDPAEMKSLLQELDTVDFKANCPHGRPVYTAIDFNEIKRKLRR